MNSPKDAYAKSVCYFLAEQLRTRRISLTRAAEIAQKMVANIRLIDREEDFLTLIKSLSGDFEELVQLEDRVSMSMHVGKRKELEIKVLEFVVRILPHNSGL